MRRKVAWALRVGAALLAVAAPAWAVPVPAAPPYTADDDPVWSPDGRWIAFVRATYGDDAVESSAVYIVRPDGRELRRVTPAGMLARFPAWSPDAKRVAFVRFGRDGSVPSLLYVAGRDGRSVRKIARTGFARPAWSPDGGRIAFGSASGPEGPGIYVVDLARMRLRLVAAPQLEQTGTGALRREGTPIAPAWSPDSERIVYSARSADYSLMSRVYVVRASGGAPRLVAIGDRPSWSYDGKLLAYRVGHRGCGIRVMPGDGEGEKTLLICGSPHWTVSAPSWSPRTNQLLGTNCFNETCTVSISGAVDGALVPGGSVGRGYGGSWSPNAKGVAFVRQESDDLLPGLVTTGIHVYDLRTRRTRSLNS